MKSFEEVGPRVGFGGVNFGCSFGESKEGLDVSNALIIESFARQPALKETPLGAYSLCLALYQNYVTIFNITHVHSDDCRKAILPPLHWRCVDLASFTQKPFCTRLRLHLLQDREPGESTKDRPGMYMKTIYAV